MQILVQCTFQIPVDVPDDIEPDPLRFMIEENSRPATGYVWSALRQVIDEHDAKSTCRGCALQGKNKIIGPIAPIPTSP